MTMKTIQVKYLPATNHKPSRWKAWSFGGLSVTKSYDYDYDEKGNAQKVAEALILKFQDFSGRTTEITGMGCLPNGDYVFTLGDEKNA